jgi:uncharacterized protein (TIGR02118 family)
MVKLIALYNHPERVADFERHYREVHVPLVLSMPHLESFRLGRPFAAAGDDPAFHLVAEMSYGSREELDRSLASEEGARAVEDLENFAAAGVTVVTVEMEEVLP